MALRRLVAVPIDDNTSTLENYGTGQLIPTIEIDDETGALYVAGQNATDRLAPVILQHTIALDHNQILALPTVSVEILPAQGANQLIVVHNALTSINFIGTISNIDPSASYGIQYGSDAGGNGVTIAADGGFPITGTGSKFWPPFFPVSAGGGGSATFPMDVGFPDQPVYISASNGALGNFTGGDAADVMTITIYYSIVQLP